VKTVLRSSKKKMGFTLIEMMVAVAILGIVLSISVPGYLSLTGQSKQKADRAGVAILNEATSLYAIKNVLSEDQIFLGFDSHDERQQELVDQGLMADIAVPQVEGARFLWDEAQYCWVYDMASGEEEDPLDAEFSVGSLAFTGTNSEQIFISGDWADLKAMAIADYGLNLTEGLLLQDASGIFVVGDNNPYVPNTISLETTLEAFGGSLLRVDPDQNFLTEDDMLGTNVWKEPLAAGDIFTDGNHYYILQYPSGINTTTDINHDVWIRIVQP